MRLQPCILAVVAAAPAAEVGSPFLDLRLELELERPPQRVHDEFTNTSGAAVPTGTYDAAVDADPSRVLRVLVASSAPGHGGGLLWGVGGEWIRDRFRIAHDVPARDEAELRSSLLGGFAMLGWAWSPTPGLELEASAYGALGTSRISWVGPDASSGAVEGDGDGGYTSEGLRLALGTCLWRHAMLQVQAGLAATQAGADIDYDTGDRSRLRLTSAGWTLGANVGYRF